MEELIKQNKKVRITTLGCGAKLPELLMGEGCSQWLAGINILYDSDVIDDYTEPTYKDTKYVSEERVKSVLRAEEGFPSAEPTLYIVISASLYKKDQRDGRENHFWFTSFDNTTKEKVTKHVELTSMTREGQEFEIKDFIRRYINKPRESDVPRVIYSGSFNPFHKGHKYALDVACKYSGGNNVIIDMSDHHPIKGEVGRLELLNRIGSIYNGCNSTSDEIEIDFGNRPKYIDKYHYYRGKFDNEPILFVVGSDVWHDHYETIAKDFKTHEGNVQFLVICRGGEGLTHSESPLLHPDSGKYKSPDISSTEIRDGHYS